MEDDSSSHLRSPPLESGTPAIKVEPQSESHEVESIEIDPLPELPPDTAPEEKVPNQGYTDEFQNDFADMLREFNANSRAERAPSSDNEYDDALRAVKSKHTEIATKESLGHSVHEDRIELKFLEGALYQAEKRQKKARDHETRQSEENAMFFPEGAGEESDIPMNRAPTRSEAMGTPIPAAPISVSDDDSDSERAPKSTKRGKKTSQSRGRNARATQATRGKTRVQKRTPAARRGGRGGRGGRGNPGMGSLNMGSLMRNPIVEDAQRNQGLRAQPTFEGATTKPHALSALIASIPKEHQDTTRGMKAKLDRACRQFKWKGHGSMKPDPDTGRFRLKGMTSSLKHFQLFGAAWGVARESGPTAPFGGILADTMGYGKTVQMIAIMVENQPKRDAKNKTTLVVVPSSIVQQWLEEIAKHTDDHIMESVTIYKSGSRILANDVGKELRKFSVVITTYTEPPAHLVTEKAMDEWWEMPFYRVVLDEAQTIKNHESRTSKACRLVTAKYKWVLTGTPLSNCMEELYPYFDFLGVEGAASYPQFKANYAKRNDVTMQRLDAILRKVMIRRTGSDRLFGAPLTSLPALDHQTIQVSFNPVERAIYAVVRQRFINRINDWSTSGRINQLTRNIFVMLLRLRQICGHVLMVTSTIRDLLEAEDIEKLWKVIERQLQGPVNDVGTRTATILKKILRDARDEDQPTRATPMASSGSTPNETIDLTIDDSEFDFRGFFYRLQQEGSWEDIRQRSRCSACNEIPEAGAKLSVPCGHLYCEECLKVILESAREANLDSAECLACHGSITASTDLTAMERIAEEAGGVPRASRESPSKAKSDAKKKEEMENAWLDYPNVENLSTKVQAITSQMQQWITKDPGAKIVVFTLFIPMVKLLAKVCSRRGWGYQEFTGKVRAELRNKALQQWKDPEKEHKVLLMSMKAGGLGLNLVEASYVIIVDPWWNEPAEDQAFSRVYRIGQQRDCVVRRFVIADAIDTQLMLHLQKLKAQECDRVVDGRSTSELSIPDLIRLFGPTRRDPETNAIVVEGDDDGLDEFIMAQDQSPIDDSDVEETMPAPARPRE
ncbi:hypothetical protein LTR70_006042 [Exophiala xenobiotica]|nr:hypothetical protein LTR70_006042 [Exophiala xenobiotica]